MIIFVLKRRYFKYSYRKINITTQTNNIFGLKDIVQWLIILRVLEEDNILCAGDDNNISKTRIVCPISHVQKKGKIKLSRLHLLLTHL